MNRLIQHIEQLLSALADSPREDRKQTLRLWEQFRRDFDETLQIPTKALQALCEIGGQRALDYLRHVSTTEHGLLAEEASELLANMK